MLRSEITLSEWRASRKEEILSCAEPDDRGILAE
jgi:hypothetical protein